LVQKIKESKDVTPWKVEKGGISIEDTCKGLLVKICEVSSTFKTVEAQKVSNLIIEILSQIYGKDVFNEFKLQNTNFFKQFKERRSKLALILDSKVGYDDSIHFGDSIDITKREATIKKTLFEDILKLSKDNNVAVTPQEINTLFEWWKTKCDSEARVSKADFKQGLEEKFGIRDKMALEQYYFQFDPKSVGFVDFREFVIGLAVLNKQKKIIQQKEAEDNVLKMFFRIYDLDGNGYITMEELYSLLKNIKDAQGVRYSIDDLKAFTIQKFREIDRDGNGKIDFDEFKDAVISKKLPVPTELNKN
jgi:Ca2+-binding EF-hand superfamily protein